jgi:hypothetical protein
MTKAYKMIDFGPLALPFLDDINSKEMQNDNANPFDVEKLNNLLHDKRKNNKDVVQLEEENLFENISKISAFKNNDKNIDLIKLAELMALIAETVAVGIATSVSLKINPSLLPNTTLVAKEIDQGILFEFYIKDENHRSRLVENLDNLTKDLSKKLRCTVQIFIFDPLNPLVPIQSDFDLLEEPKT